MRKINLEIFSKDINFTCKRYPKLKYLVFGMENFVN